MKAALQRKCSCGGKCSQCAGTAPAVAPSSVHRVLQSSGQQMDNGFRTRMERQFGQGFQDVRLHTGSQAGESARAVNAQAYTVGSNIIFAPATYNPASTEGQRLIAHELGHVVQQRGSHASGSIQ